MILEVSFHGAAAASRTSRTEKNGPKTDRNPLRTCIDSTVASGKSTWNVQSGNVRRTVWMLRAM